MDFEVLPLNLSCPKCGEDMMDNVEFLGDIEKAHCLTCGIVFDPNIEIRAGES